MADLEVVKEMPVNPLSETASEREEKKQLFDLRDKGLTNIPVLEEDDLKILILDNNKLSRLDGLDKYVSLTQFSACNNNIVRMTGIHSLSCLTVLTLSNNSIVAIEGVEELSQLSWLDLSSNSIKIIENLPKGKNLHHLDLSDNDISQFSDISYLENLKTLLLHSNNISSLKPANTWLPANVEILSLADNSILNLNEVLYLAGLSNLKQMSIANNPCVLTSEGHQLFNYRPFVLSWCCSLEIIDGMKILEKERSQSKWLCSQIKANQIYYNQHQELVNYLSEIFPISTQLRSEENTKLSQLLRQQRKSKLSQNSPAASPRSHTSSWNSAVLSEENRDINSSHLSLDPVVSDVPAGRQVWAEVSDVRKPHNRDLSHCSDLRLQDVTSDCETRSSVSLLESDSVYLPFDVPSSPIEIQRPFTAPEKLSDVSKNIESTNQQINIVTRPHTAIDSRLPTFTKYDSLEQRPIRPINQHVMKGHVKPSFEMARPMTSSSEPLVSTHKDSMPPTARSQDYESSSEQTVSESESHSQIPVNSGHSPHHHETVKPVVHSSHHHNEVVKPVVHAHQDKLNLIKAIAGSKKAIYCNDSSLKEKISPSFYKNAVNKIKSSVRHSPHFRSVGKVDEATELLDRHYKTTGGSPDKESKEAKGKINMERMEKRNVSIPNSAIISNLQSDHKAATKIQAFWRGYWAREHNNNVVSIRKEIRARRAEDHITLLRKDLEKNRQLYEKEKKMRILQMEAIRMLYQEVQVLKSHSITSSKDLNNSSNIGSPILSAAATSFMTGNGEISRASDLERTCLSLQNQVSQLQETLASVSSAVFKTNSSEISSFILSEDSDSIHIEPYKDDSNFYNKSVHDDTKFWSLIPNSLSPYPSEEEDSSYFQLISVPGAPTPPRCLKLQHHSPTALVLSWQQPSSSGSQEPEGNKHVIGYRVYVNDKLKAFISNYTSALVGGLNSALTYKFYVKALSGFGESLESNILMSKLATSSERVKYTSNTDSSRDSEAEEHDKPRHKQRRHRKSPRPDQKKTKSSQKLSSLELSEEMLQTVHNLSPSGIFTHPKLHKHRRHKSKDLNGQDSQNDLAQNLDRDNDQHEDKKLNLSSTNISRNVSSASTHKSIATEQSESIASTSLKQLPQKKDSPKPGSSKSTCVPQARRKDLDEVKRSPASGSDGGEEAKFYSFNMSETFTIDKGSSHIESINAIAEQNLAVLTFGSPSSGQKGHRRTRSKDSDKIKQEGSVMEADKETLIVDESSQSQKRKKRSSESRAEGDGGSDSSGKGHVHRHQHSKDLHISDILCVDGASKDKEEDERTEEDVTAHAGHGEGLLLVNRPVLDGRLRHSSGSRPCSPVVSEERTRMSVAEQLKEQSKRIKSKDISVADNNRRSSSNDSISSTLGDSSKRSPSADSLPESSREDDSAVHSTHSLKSSPVNQNKMSRDSYLLPNTLICKKSNNVDDKDCDVGTKPSSDDEKRTSRSRNLSESDVESVPQLPPRAPSESSSGSHSDDSRHVRHRGHQRTPSDHWRPPTEITSVTHSPIIREGGGIKKSGTSVKRNQSFPGILPSKHQDTKTSPNEDNTAKVDDQIIENPVHSRAHLRSRTPSPVGSRTPILSAAQLKRYSDGGKQLSLSSGKQ